MKTGIKNRLSCIILSIMMIFSVISFVPSKVEAADDSGIKNFFISVGETSVEGKRTTLYIKAAVDSTTPSITIGGIYTEPIVKQSDNTYTLTPFINTQNERVNFGLADNTYLTVSPYSIIQRGSSMELERSPINIAGRNGVKYKADTEDIKRTYGTLLGKTASVYYAGNKDEKFIERIYDDFMPCGNLISELDVEALYWEYLFTGKISKYPETLEGKGHLNTNGPQMTIVNMGEMSKNLKPQQMPLNFGEIRFASDISQYTTKGFSLSLKDQEEHSNRYDNTREVIVNETKVNILDFKYKTGNFIFKNDVEDTRFSNDIWNYFEDLTYDLSNERDSLDAQEYNQRRDAVRTLRIGAREAVENANKEIAWKALLDVVSEDDLITDEYNSNLTGYSTSKNNIKLYDYDKYVNKLAEKLKNGSNDTYIKEYVDKFVENFDFTNCMFEMGQMVDVTKNAVIDDAYIRDFKEAYGDKEGKPLTITKLGLCPKDYQVTLQAQYKYGSETVTDTIIRYYIRNAQGKKISTIARVSYYDFEGWEIPEFEKNLTYGELSDLKGNNSSIIDKAKLKLKKYTIKYNTPTDLKTTATKPNNFSWDITKKDMKITDVASATGYKFNGWYGKTSDPTSNKAEYDCRYATLGVLEIPDNSTGLDLYGKFTPITYTSNIIPNMQGIYVESPKKTYSIEEAVTLTDPKILRNDFGISNDVVNEGIEFINYTLNGQPITELGGSADKINLGDITANYSAKSVLLTFDAGEGTVDTESASVTFLSKIPELPVPTLKGYNFVKWENNAREIKAGDTSKFVEDTTLTAKYTPKKAYLIYDANGGLVSGTKVKVTYDKEISELSTPTREGFTFVGWFIGDRKVDNGDISDFEEDTTIVAKWAETEYSIKYDADGGKVNSEGIDVKYNDPIPELAVPTKEGYTFDGWFYENTEIKAEDIYSYTEDITITAKWTPITVKITLDADGGTVSAQTIDAVYNDTISGLTDATKAENTFIGWFDGDKEVKNGDISTYTSDVTLKAKWQKDAAGDLKATDLNKYITADEKLTDGQKKTLKEIVESIKKSDGTVSSSDFKKKAMEVLSEEGKTRIDGIISNTVNQTPLTKVQEAEIYKTPEAQKAKLLRVKKLKVKAKKKALKLTWKKQSGVTYQIQVSTKKNFKKKTKTYTSTTNKYKIKKLKSNKKYYVRVRTVKVVDGVEIYGKWSAVKQKKTK